MIVQYLLVNVAKYSLYIMTHIGAWGFKKGHVKTSSFGDECGERASLGAHLEYMTPINDFVKSRQHGWKPLIIYTK